MATSSSFDQLSYGVQRWVYKQGWQSLRGVQEQAVPVILTAQEDVLITAPTAAGKTEAAFLPIVSWLEDTEHRQSYGALCLSPLKALINDQYQRLLPLCESAHTQITPWHGDVSSSVKQRSWKAPAGILLITPESLESLFVNRSHELKAKLAGLKYIVIDEFHAFIGRERGQQLISLLARLEDLIGRPACRIALSATIGSPSVALNYLRPDNSRPALHLDASGEKLNVQLALTCYLSVTEDRPASVDMAKDLFLWLRGKSHLVFANSRRQVEELTDSLTKQCEASHLPVEFFAHHGSLGRDVRHFVEQRLKNANKPITAIATSTLELGIDIGDVTSIAQVGAPANVSSVRQRLGRSGRRKGQPAILRLLVTGHSQKKAPDPIDLLEVELFQTLAIIELMLERWIEPPDEHTLHLSTLVQQILSMIAFQGGISAAKAYHILCQKGPWQHISSERFGEVLRALGSNQVISQLSNGELVVDTIGEQLVSSYQFYTAFEVPEEYRLEANGKTLGNLPITTPYVEGQLLLFNGQRWTVTSIDTEAKVMILQRATNGKAPHFGGEAAPVHKVIRQRMLSLYQNDDLPPYCDEQTKSLLSRARAYFRHHNLANKPLIKDGRNSFWFIWEGDRVLDSIKVCASLIGYSADKLGPCVVIEKAASLEDMSGQLRQFFHKHTAADIAEKIHAQPLGKFDEHLSEAVIKRAFVEEKLSVEQAIRYLHKIKE